MMGDRSTSLVLHQTATGRFRPVGPGDGMCWKYYLVMVIPTPARHPAGVSNSNMSRNDRLARRSLRAPAALAGVAVIALSLLLSVAPAMGAANSGHSGGNGTSGNLKVHDAGTGAETLGTDNEPHVCAFWLGFTFDAPFEAGTWVLVSWAPTGDGSTIASGVYDTTGDGTDSSSVLDVPAGHYRVEWAATGASASKKKTFWVNADCGETESQAEESQAEEPASPAEESQPEASQTDEPVSADESTIEEPASGPADESVAEEPSSPDDESAVEEPVTDPADEPTTEEPSSAGDEPVADDPGTPPQESAETPGDAADDDEAVEAQDPGLTDPGTPPAQDVLGGAGNDDPTMSDTAIPTTSASGGLVAAMVLLALIVVLGTARRSRSLDRELTKGDV